MRPHPDIVGSRRNMAVADNLPVDIPLVEVADMLPVVALGSLLLVVRPVAEVVVVACHCLPDIAEVELARYFLPVEVAEESGE